MIIFGLNLILVIGCGLILAKPLGILLAGVGEDQLPASLKKIDSALLKLFGIKSENEQSWSEYAISLVSFELIGTLALYAILRTQKLLPLNPENVTNLKPDTAFNTAISFITNTNWQSYTAETDLSYFSQMVGLGVQNFISPSIGIAVAFALIRGFKQHQQKNIGNFWKDIVRIQCYVLLPLSFIFGIILMSQGVIQNFKPSAEIQALESQQTHVIQKIPMGPVASQEAIKMLGTNGGGFFSANSAHPYENPNAWTNLLEILEMLLLPMAMCFCFGEMYKDQRQGKALLYCMIILFSLAAFGIYFFEQSDNKLMSNLAVEASGNPKQSGGNMEGKETRFGIVGSSLFSCLTTATACGAVNSAHESMHPLSETIMMTLMQTGEVIFGGAGSGLTGMLMFAILAIFIAGLMTGRTPEYLGKKIESFEIKMISITILAMAGLTLISAGTLILNENAKEAFGNAGIGGFTELLYALTSVTQNNGSSLGGLSADIPIYNIILGIIMFFGRFLVIIPVLAIAGSFSKKKHLESTIGTMATHHLLFIILLSFVIMIIGILTYTPSLLLGPVSQYLRIL